jgi:hypothetical protein
MAVFQSLFNLSYQSALYHWGNILLGRELIVIEMILLDLAVKVKVWMDGSIFRLFGSSLSSWQRDEWVEAGGARMNVSVEKQRLGQSRQLLCDVGRESNYVAGKLP